MFGDSLFGVRLFPALAHAGTVLGRKYGLPKAVSGHNNYYLWGPPGADRSVVIALGESPAEVGESCGEVEEAAVFRHEYNMSYEFMHRAAGSMVCPKCGALRDVPIVVGRHFRGSWREYWPRCKKFG